jgi:hypothetical protein
MARRSNLTNLIVDAFNSEGGATASNRNWIATRMGNYVGVEHHGTHMFNVSRAGVVEPVDSGHGSTSDRCGVRRITAGFGCGGPQGVGYRELYAEDAPPEDSLSGDQWRSPLRDAGVIDTIRPPTANRPWSDHMPHATAISADHVGDPVPAGGGDEHRFLAVLQRTRQDREGNYGNLAHLRRGDTTGAGRTPEDARWEAHTQSGLAADEFTYQDENTRGPDYSQPDPFDFSDPEEARQAQAITDMEETIRGLDERSQRPRNEG